MRICTFRMFECKHFLSSHAHVMSYWYFRARKSICLLMQRKGKQDNPSASPNSSTNILCYSRHIKEHAKSFVRITKHEIFQTLNFSKTQFCQSLLEPASQLPPLCSFLKINSYLNRFSIFRIQAMSLWCLTLKTILKCVFHLLCNVRRTSYVS